MSIMKVLAIILPYDSIMPHLPAIIHSDNIHTFSAQFQQEVCQDPLRSQVLHMIR